MATPEDTGGSERQFWIGVARAFGGAILFALPMFMTMELWWLGFHMDRLRLAAFLASGIPLLVGLSHYIGFEETFGWVDDLVDSFVAYGVGFVAAGIMMMLFSVVETGMSAHEVVGKISVQALPGAIGAMLAQNLLGTSDDESEERDRSYFSHLFIMLVGSLFLAFNIAPTDEMTLISYQMTTVHALVLVVLTLVLMHAFIYAVQFKGQKSRRPEEAPVWSLFLRFTATGYAIALLVSLYALWVFGRTDGTGFDALVMSMLVLGFPAAMGAAAARLIL
ncbi:MAG: TIGR02587 family membrane protein [Sphingomonadales bacterium]